MVKGAVIDEPFVHAIGLSEHLQTLSAPIGNKHHAVLGDLMFHIQTQEIPETIYMERKYVFENLVSIKSTYIKGDRILVWLQRSLRRNPNARATDLVPILVVRELFLLGDWREFHRFKTFVKTMRILDAQAREWLSDHHEELPEFAATEDGVQRVLEQLGQIAEWPDLDGTSRRNNSLEMVAKTFGKGLNAIRGSAALPTLMLGHPPDVRFNIFRLLSFVEDEKSGSQSLFRFLGNIAVATGDVELVRATRELKNSRDLQRAFGKVRKYLFSLRQPAA